MRNSKRGAVPVISQLSGSCVITGAAGGEWRTNSGSGARCGPLIIRFELTSHPKALWALCLLQLTSHQRRPPEEFVLDSHDTTRGDFGKKICFLRSVFCVCRFQTRQTLRNWSEITSGQRHSIALYDRETGSFPLNPTSNFPWDVLDSVCRVKEEEWKTYWRSLALLADTLWGEKVRLVKVHVFKSGLCVHDSVLKTYQPSLQVAPSTYHQPNKLLFCILQCKKITSVCEDDY